MKKLVLLDAGHGLDTAGRRVDSGDFRFREGMFNREIVQRIIVMLLERSWIKFEVVTSEWFDIGINERVKRVNERFGAFGGYEVVLVSIHANAHAKDGFGAANGIETLYHHTSNSSKRLAESVQGGIMKKIIAATNRGIKPRKNLGVLKRTLCPAIIVECGFFTNYAELMLMSNDEHKCNIAAGVVDGLVNYFMK